MPADISARNADNDSALATDNICGGYGGASKCRIATSIPYNTATVTDTRTVGFAMDILNADIVDSYTTHNFKDYNYAGTNQNASYLYRKATVLTYL